MTAEHLKVGLESTVVCGLFGRCGESFCTGTDAGQAIRLGRMTALQKADGGVRGVVVGEVFRRLNTNHGTAIQQGGGGREHTHSSMPSQPGQGLSVSHTVQALTSENPETTILSVDGVGAYDLISRNAHVSRRAGYGGWGQDDPIHPPILRFAVDVLVG